jgi:hypothetical protein
MGPPPRYSEKIVTECLLFRRWAASHFNNHYIINQYNRQLGLRYLVSRFLYGSTQSKQKHDALSRGMGREKFRDVVVEEGEARRAQTLGIG